MPIPVAKRVDPRSRAVKSICQLSLDTEDVDFVLQGFRYVNEGVRYYLSAMRLLYSEAESELSGFFNPGEWEYMARCLRGVEGVFGRNYTDAASALSKDDLCRTLRQVRHRAKATLCGVSGYRLADKIASNLTSVHIMVIRRRVYDFWAHGSEDEIGEWSKY